MGLLPKSMEGKLTMATKLTDECLAKCADDEPIFVLRAKDLSAPSIVRVWADKASEILGPYHAKVIEARKLAMRMTTWQTIPGNGARWPD